MEAIEGYKGLGDTSILISNSCKAELTPLPDANSQVSLTRLTCDKPCLLGRREANFGLGLDDRQKGNVIDPTLEKYLPAKCVYTEPQIEASLQPVPEVPTVA